MSPGRRRRRRRMRNDATKQRTQKFRTEEKDNPPSTPSLRSGLARMMSKKVRRWDGYESRHRRIHRRTSCCCLVSCAVMCVRSSLDLDLPPCPCPLLSKVGGLLDQGSQRHRLLPKVYAHVYAIRRSNCPWVVPESFLDLGRRVDRGRWAGACNGQVYVHIHEATPKAGEAIRPGISR